jgi:leucyl aminopeptidase
MSRPLSDYALEADVALVPWWEKGGAAVPLGRCRAAAEALVSTGDFSGKAGEIAWAYEGKKRILLVGLGPESKGSPEGIRRAYGAGIRAAIQKKLATAEVGVVGGRLAGAAVEGALLANYVFADYKSETGRPLKAVTWVGEAPQLAERIATVAEGVYFVRDWVNRNADEATPEGIAQAVADRAKGRPALRLEVRDERWIAGEKMGLLLAVARGSPHPPRFVELSYRGDPASQEHVVLIGKGVTYDTGGLSLKPTDGMLTMKSDMAGAATVLGAALVAERLGLKVNVTAVAPLTENSIDGKSYKVGDVYRSRSGKTVEVTNTDAEGRLILADAISYAIDRLKPTCLIDVATLTGAVVVALGEEIAGFFSDHDRIVRELAGASEETGEIVWRLPLYADYFEAYKSDIADMMNSSGREAGSIKAALFLQQFVGETPWAHLDVAGPCFQTKPKHYNPTKATGFGLRLLLSFVERWHAAPPRGK